MVGCRRKEEGVNATVLGFFWRGQRVKYSHKTEEVGNMVLILGYLGIDERNGSNLHKTPSRSS